MNFATFIVSNNHSHAIFINEDYSTNNFLSNIRDTCLRKIRTGNTGNIMKGNGFVPERTAPVFYSRLVYRPDSNFTKLSKEQRLSICMGSMRDASRNVDAFCKPVTSALCQEKQKILSGKQILQLNSMLNASGFTKTTNLIAEKKFHTLTVARKPTLGCNTQMSMKPQLMARFPAAALFKGAVPDFNKNLCILAAVLIGYNITRDQLVNGEDGSRFRRVVTAGIGLTFTAITAPLTIQRTAFLVNRNCRKIITGGLPAFVSLAAVNITAFLMFEELKCKLSSSGPHKLCIRPTCARFEEKRFVMITQSQSQ